LIEGEQKLNISYLQKIPKLVECFSSKRITSAAQIILNFRICNSMAF